MKINISKKDRDMIITMLENGAGNGRISLKYPGITRTQIENIRAEFNKGTAETKRKLKIDPLLGLFRRGDIDIYALYAAEHIRYAYSLMTADIRLRVMKFESMIDVIGRAEVERESALQARLQNQYADWFDKCGEERIKVGPILHVLTEPVTLKDTDRYYGYRNGRSRAYLIAGLKLYVKMFHPKQGIKG
ncbi:MAG: hypothetical protein H6912_05240 [Kordiimonadaceae bacterium]|nr:hypothetical protein [Kordiimonadaceae bacterium]